MENILEKLQQTNNDKRSLNHWSLEEQQKLLEIYFIFSKKEHHIFNLIYHYHECDSWEDIFRDYRMQYLKDKAIGVEIAITQITQIIKEHAECKVEDLRSEEPT